jgi:hypothetical protein
MLEKMGQICYYVDSEKGGGENAKDKEGAAAREGFGVHKEFSFD